jgi:hypothetical protein
MYLETSRAIADRIHGLVEAARPHKSYPQDSFGRVRFLRDNISSVLSELRSFRDQSQHALPPAAVIAIDNLAKSTGDLLSMATGQVGPPELRDEAVFTTLFQLSTFTTGMASILSTVQWPLRPLSERAFQHLQRLIVVDEQFGEVECEKLGAVHLLWHGIWAFKVDAKGGRTDLVYQQPREDAAREQQYAEGFVMTEWKIENSPEQARTKCSEAREQAKLYASGVLGGTELTAYRYVVVVSRQEIQLPDPIQDGGVEYKHINIVVNPSPPSQAARRQPRRQVGSGPR